MQHHSKLLFRLTNSILGRIQKSPYSDFTDDDLLNIFDSFFNDKITNIISKLPKPISISLLSLLSLKNLLLTPHPLINIDLFPIYQYFIKP